MGRRRHRRAAAGKCDGLAALVASTADRVAGVVECHRHGTNRIPENTGGGLAEARSLHRCIHGGVLRGIDFTEQQWNLAVVGHARIGYAQRRYHGRGCDHQHAIKTHGTLDGGVGSRFNQVSTGLETLPQQLCRVSGRHLGCKRLDTNPLSGWIEGGAIAVPGDRPGNALDGMGRAGHGCSLGTQTTAQLTNNHQRRGYARGGTRRNRQIVLEVDRQVAGRHGNHQRRPGRPGIRVQALAGGARAGTIAGVAPHRHKLSVGKRSTGRVRCQVDTLREGHAACHEENRCREACLDQVEEARLELVGSHRVSPDL